MSPPEFRLTNPTSGRRWKRSVNALVCEKAFSERSGEVEPIGLLRPLLIRLDPVQLLVTAGVELRRHGFSFGSGRVPTDHIAIAIVILAPHDPGRW